MNLSIKQRHLAALRKTGFSNLDAGYVTWFSRAPIGTRFSEHVLTFKNAVYTAADFVYAFEGRPANALIVGHEAFRILAALPQFEPFRSGAALRINKCEHVGKLGNLDVWWTKSRVRDDEAIILGSTSQCRVRIL